MRTLAFVLLLFVACSGEESSVSKKLNRLANEKSVYLKQHGTNPIDWYPWGEEALEKAKKEDKPIFLSIGYSSCHWCHVMEHESFADADVAKVLNEHFVSIKVDREERPDVDTVYMNAVQLMRVQGGWPLSVWLTPDLKPFFGGTYFPKLPSRGMPGFLDILNNIAAAWADPAQRTKIAESGDRVEEILQEVMAGEDPEAPGETVLKDARASSELGWDKEQGGFGGPPRYAPKFPSPSTVEMLLRWGLRHGDEAALGQVWKTLDEMALGGIHDHVGGGFHRYSTTRDWLVPHFEKMLYDNGQLLGLYAWAYLATKNELYRETAEDIARWVGREMTNAQGGFHSAQDADDPGGPEHEGGFYVWDPQEIHVLFEGADAKVALAWFDISEKGNWDHKPGKSILQRKHAADEVAQAAGVDAKDVPGIVARLTERMYEVREKRPKPITDTKVITGWNGLMISGYARAHQAFGDPAYLQAAVKAGAFIRKHLTRDGRLMRRWAEGQADFDGVLDDYAYVIAAYLDLYETTFDRAWLEEALRLLALTDKLFWDEKDGGYFYTASDGEKLLARGKPGFDSARPSGNGVMALNQLRVAELTGSKEPRDRAEKTLHYFGGRLAQGALGFAQLLNTIDFARSESREIFIAGPKDDPATRALIDAVWKDPDQNRVLALVEPGIEKLLPPAAGKTTVDGKPAAYVCRNFTCNAPVTDPAKLK